MTCINWDIPFFCGVFVGMIIGGLLAASAARWVIEPERMRFR